MSINKINQKVKDNIEITTRGLFEREEIVRLSYLALLSGESIFMLGLPGVAKSLIARRMKYAMDGEKHFEYLMNKFSTPEEIFGPISIKELENDNYVRKIEGYLPSSEIVFLDEIWKASPAIQNTLLTIINEKIFRNGTEDIAVPLKLLISASNELPQEGEGLEALYDRFLIRYYVNPASTRQSFENIIDSRNGSDFNPNDLHKITEEDINEVRDKIESIKTSNETFEFINEFKNRLSVELKEKKPYISDRRWKKILNMIKINALMSGRKATSLNDLFIIKHCAWESDSSSKQIQEIFDSCFVDVISRRMGASISEIQGMFKSAKKHLKNGFIDTKQHFNLTYNGIKYYKFKSSSYYFWIPLDLKGQDNQQTKAVYYNRSAAGKPNGSYSSNWTNWNLDHLTRAKNGKWSYGDNLLTPIIKGAIEKDFDTLDKASSTVSEAMILISRLIDRVKNEMDELKKQESLFAFDLGYAFDKTEAIIQDKCKEESMKFAQLLGKIESASKTKK